MPKLHKLLRKRRRVPIGELNSKIFVEDRIQDAPSFGTVDAAMSFGEFNGATEVWAKVDTKSGKVVFDGIETDRRVTHEITFRRLSGLTAESWMRLQDGTRLDIVSVEDLDGRGEFQIAQCEATGASSKQGSAR